MSGEVNKNYVPLWRSCRGQLAMTGTVGFFFLYLLRVNLSVAMVCMVKKPPLHNDTSTINMSHSLTMTNNVTMETHQEESVCGQLEKKHRATDKGEFTWTKTTQGSVLGSLYYGYMITQIPGGWLATKYGGKHVLGSGLLLSMIATLFIPLGARTHLGFLIGLRVLMGLGMGVMFPSMHALIGAWSPPMERTKIAAFTYAGVMIGTVCAMFLSGMLCDVDFDNGWPLIFYVFGGAGLLWYVSWCFLAYSSPAAHPRISERESLYIRESVGLAARSNNRRHKTPWLSMFTSLPVWAILVTHICNNWGNYTIVTCIPMYMREVLKFDIKQNGLYSALPYICMYIVTLVVSTAVDSIRSRRIVSTTVIRKICQAIAFVGCGIMLAIIGFIDCSKRGVAVALLTISVTMLAFGRCGYLVNHIDIAPRYAGILFGISNCIANIPGIVAPSVASALTPNGTQAEWQKVFFICSGVYAFGALFFVVFSSGEVQPWALVTDAPPPQAVKEGSTPEKNQEKLHPVNIYPHTDFSAGHEKQALDTTAI